MTNYKRAVAQVDAERPVFSSNCSAFGCPMPGSFSHGTLGAGQWYCRHHSSVTVAENDGITALIRKYFYLYNMERAINAIMPRYSDQDFSHLQSEINNSLIERGHEDLVYDPAQPILKWQERLLNGFDALVRPRGESGFMPRTASVSSAPRALGELISGKERQYAD